MASVRSSDAKSSFIITGDFNAHYREWLNSVRAINANARAVPIFILFYKSFS